MPKKHPSLDHLAFSGRTVGCTLPDVLSPLVPEEDAEWVDTGGVFMPSVLDLYPEVIPYIGAAGYTVGHGCLVAVDELFETLAVYEGGGVWSEDF
jgi:hypothetical protein